MAKSFFEMSSVEWKELFEKVNGGLPQKERVPLTSKLYYAEQIYNLMTYESKRKANEGHAMRIAWEISKL